MKRGDAPCRATVAALALLLILALPTSAHSGSETVASGSGSSTGGGTQAAKESFKTDLFTGAMTTAFPLALPPGTAGHQPEVILSYNSHQGDSWLGRGWSLDFGSIRRMTKHGSPAYNDSDRFQLGDDPLVRADNGFYRAKVEDFARVERVNTAGQDHWVVHGTDGTTSWYGYDATSRMSGPTGQSFSWFLSRVIDRNGNFIRFDYYTPGETGGDSGVLYPKRIAYSFRSDGSEALGSSWPNSPTVRNVSFELEDRTDRFIGYHAGILTKRSKRLTRIIVTAGTRAVATYDVKYVGESDAGYRHRNQRSLIEQIVHLGADGTTALPTQTFHYSGDRQPFSSGGDPADYGSPAYSSSGSRAAQLAAVGVSIGINVADSQWGFLDVNADTALDATFTSTSSVDSRVHLNKRGAGGMTGFWPFLNQNAAAYAVPTVDPDASGPKPLAPLPIRSAFSRWVDYDGDGRTDLVFDRWKPSQPPEVRAVYRNTGSGWQSDSGPYANPPALVRATANCLGPGGEELPYGLIEFVDVNADGLVDVLEQRMNDPGPSNCSSYTTAPGTWSDQLNVRNVYLNTGGGWSATSDPSWNARLSSVLTAMQIDLGRVLVFDLNGDGIADFARDPSRDGAADWGGVVGPFVGGEVWLGTGSSATGWIAASTLGFTGIPLEFRPVDIDGDGLVDHLGSAPRFNTGGSMVSPLSNWAIPAWFTGLGAQDLVADVDGDALVDHVRSTGATATAHVSGDGDAQGNRASPAGLLVAIKLPIKPDGGAAQGNVAVSYRASTEGSCYDPDLGGCHALVTLLPGVAGAQCGLPLLRGSITGGAFIPDGVGDSCGFPIETLPIALQTVQSTRVDDAIGGVAMDRIDYDRGVWNQSDREHRGFGLVKHTPQAGSYVHPMGGSEPWEVSSFNLTLFYQHNFLKGQPAITELYAVRAGISVLLEQTISKYFVTRADLAQTYFLVGVNFRTECDSDAPPTTSCTTPFDIQDFVQTSYLAPPPFERFQAGFGPTNPDADDAYLVLYGGEGKLIYDGEPTAAVAERVLWHDPYGKVQFELHLGNAADLNDDAVTITSFAEDPCYDGLNPLQECFPSALPRNLHDLPSSQTRWAAVNQFLSLQAQSEMLYDGLNAGWARMGNLGRVSTGFGADLGHVDYVHLPSGYGLPERVSERYSGVPSTYTVSTYDASQTFVAQSTLGGTLTRRTTYDPPGAPAAMGLVYLEEDEGGSWVARSADTFGRTTCITRAYAASEAKPASLTDACSLDWATKYNQDPSFPFRVWTEVRSESGASPILGRTYFDGLGREVRTESDGIRWSGSVELNRRIISKRSYDSQGRTAFQARPYFEDAVPGTLLGTALWYDERGRPCFAKGPDGATSQIQYQKLWTTRVDAVGRTLRERRNERDQIVEVVEVEVPLGGPAVEYSTRYLYDALGRLRATCDSAATSCPVLDCGAGLCRVVGGDPKHSIRIEYDSLGRRTRLADPDGGVTTSEYDPRGNLTASIDARGRRVVRVYDGLGRLRCENERGAVSCSESEGGDVEYVYGDTVTPIPANAANRVVQVRTAGFSYDYQYDAAGLTSIAQMTRRDGSRSYQRTWSYDWVGRPRTLGYPDGELLTRTYDRMGVDRITSNRPRQYLSGVQHNADGNPIRLALGNGALREITYHPTTGMLQTILDSKGGNTILDRSYTWDLSRKVSSVVHGVPDAAENLSSITYDSLGRLLSVTRNGASVTNSYDRLGNLLQKGGQLLPYQHPSKPHAVFDAANPTRWVYDAAGNMTLRNGQQLIYDARGRLALASGTLETSYSYDFGGERSRVKRGADVSEFFGTDLEVANGVRIVKSIDAAGMVISEVSTVPTLGGAGAEALRRWQDGRRWIGGVAAAEVTLGLGLLAIALWTRRRRRLPLGEASIATATMLAVVLFPTAIAWAQVPNGDLNSDGRVDSADALLAARIVAGELASPSPTHMARADVAPLNQNANGEVTSADAMLIAREVQEGDVDADGLSTALELERGWSPFRRDSDGDAILDGSDNPDQDTDLDGLTDIQEATAGTFVSQADSDGDGLVDSRDPLPLSADILEVHWVHTDHLGSASALSNTGGSLVRKVAYDEWGGVRSNVRVGSAPVTTPTPVRTFTAQRPDAATGLMYYGARYYDAEIGRFIQPDPIVDPLNPQSLNRYSYVLNDPLNRIDPTGRWSFGGFFGGLGRAVGGAFSAIGSGLRWAGSMLSSAWGWAGHSLSAGLNRLVQEGLRFHQQMRSWQNSFWQLSMAGHRRARQSVATAWNGVSGWVQARFRSRDPSDVPTTGASTAGGSTPAPSQGGVQAFETPVVGPSLFRSTSEALRGAFNEIVNHPRFEELRSLGEFGAVVSPVGDGSRLWRLHPTIKFSPGDAIPLEWPIPGIPVHSHRNNRSPSTGASYDMGIMFRNRPDGATIGGIGAVIGPDPETGAIGMSLFIPFNQDRGLVWSFPHQ